MSRTLITPSLYNAWRWWRSAEEPEAARKDFVTTLRREEIPPNELMQKGREFEEDVQKLATGSRDMLLDLKDPAYQDCVHEVADIVEGGLWQERIYHPLRFRRHGECLLYGKIDVIKGPWVYDIKFVSRYEIGKYFHNIQHVAYMAGSAQKRFAYLASDGRSVWREDYFWDGDAYRQMLGNLADMLDDIRCDDELSRLYAAHWGARWDPATRQERSAPTAPPPGPARVANATESPPAGSAGTSGERPAHLGSGPAATEHRQSSTTAERSAQPPPATVAPRDTSKPVAHAPRDEKFWAQEKFVLPETKTAKELLYYLQKYLSQCRDLFDVKGIETANASRFQEELSANARKEAEQMIEQRRKELPA